MLKVETKTICALYDENGLEIPTVEEVGAFTTSEERLFLLSPDGGAVAIFDSDGDLESTIAEPNLPPYDVDLQTFTDKLRENYYLDEDEFVVEVWRDGEYKLKFIET
jgi:hypothetical protein